MRERGEEGAEDGDASDVWLPSSFLSMIKQTSIFNLKELFFYFDFQIRQSTVFTISPAMTRNAVLSSETVSLESFSVFFLL